MPQPPLFESDGEPEQHGLVARSRRGDNAEPLTITQISAALKRTVEDRFGHVRLRGELSGVKRAASGHLYCALKDDKAVIDGVMWKGAAGALPFVPEDGIEVVATGKVTTYAGRSKYQIVIDSMEIAGEGALLALLEKTRLRLEAEGLFDPARKRGLPFLPQTIGVVTSPTGAVIRDILHRLADRFPSHVLVWPVLVQGQGAAEQVANAVRGFSSIDQGGKVPRPDIVIVARGGGSVEDLWGFNDEVVVRAIAESTIPIISAVGHETDTTLSDYAADRRAPTPTAAAEIAVPVRRELQAAIDDLAHRKKRCALRPVTMGRERLDARVGRLPRPESLLQAHTQRLDDMAERLKRGLKDRAAQARERLQGDSAKLSGPLLRARWTSARDRLAAARLVPTLPQRRLLGDRQRFNALARLYASLDPEAPLQRGFVLVKDADGRLVRSRAVGATQPLLEVKFADGTLAVVPQTQADSPLPSVPLPSTRKAKRAKPAPAATQDDLFG